MYKSIKKSCFAIALSFVFFAFYSVDVNSEFLVKERNALATAPTNLPSREQVEPSKKAGLIAVITGQIPNQSGVVYTATLMVVPGHAIQAFSADPRLEYTVQFEDMQGKAIGAPQKIIRRSSLHDLILTLPPEAEKR